MVSVAKLSVGQERYYLDAAGDRVDVADAVGEGREGYYLDPSEARGKWVGGGAARLGLRGDVGGEELRRVLAGVHPTSGLTLRSGGRVKVAAFDATFSAPKSISVVFGLGSPEVRTAVRVAHDDAVAEALGYLERSAAAVRRGHAGAFGGAGGRVRGGGVPASLVAGRRSAAAHAHRDRQPRAWLRRPLDGA